MSPFATNYRQESRPAIPLTASPEITGNTDVPVSVRTQDFNALAKVRGKALFSVKLADFQATFRWQVRKVDRPGRSTEKQRKNDYNVC